MYKNPFVSREEKKGQRRINPFCNWNTLIRSNSVTIAAKPHQEPRQISPPRVTQLSYTSAKTPDPTTRACRNLQRGREREREREGEKKRGIASRIIVKRSSSASEFTGSPCYFYYCLSREPQITR